MFRLLLTTAKKEGKKKGRERERKKGKGRREGKKEEERKRSPSIEVLDKLLCHDVCVLDRIFSFVIVYLGRML